MISVHVIHHDSDDRWHVTVDVEDTPLYADGDGYELKDHAIIAARALSRYVGGELFIHTLDGQIAERDSHGGDPERRPG